MALTQLKTSGIADDAVTTDKLANAINTERTANTAKVQTTINNNADNRVITGSGTANTLEGEANLTWDATTLKAEAGNPVLELSGTTSNGGNTSLHINANANHWVLEADNYTSQNLFSIKDGTPASSTARLAINSSGSTLLNTSAVTNTNDQLTVKRPASDFTEMSLSLDATTATGSSANALIFTKSKGSYWNGYAFQSSHGYIGALLGKREASGTSDQEIRMEIGGDSPNQNEEKTWTFQNDGDLSIDHGNLVMGTAGKGIDFSAQTASSATGASASSELLNHYESGTFTPAYDGTWTNISNSNVRHARYTKIGNTVHIWMEYFMSSNNGEFANASNIRGFPFSGPQSLYVPATLGIMYGPSSYSMDSAAAGRCYFDAYDDRLYFRMGTYNGIRHIWIQFTYTTG